MRAARAHPVWPEGKKHLQFLRYALPALLGALLLAAPTAQAAPAWLAVGTPGFSAGQAQYTSLAFGPDGAPYVAYRDMNSSAKVTVARFNAAASAWEAVGTPGFSGAATSVSPLAFSPDGVPYVAYPETSHSNSITVMRFNAATSAWESVGAIGHTGSNVSLAFGPDGAPHVAYQDSSNKATVMRFNGTAWQAVGTPGFSPGQVSFLSLAFSQDGKPYVAYRDETNVGRPATMRFDGMAWQSAGIFGFTPGTAGAISLAFGRQSSRPEGVPYVAYQDMSNGNKATVIYEYMHNGWSWAGAQGFSADQVAFIALAVAPDGAPHVVYQDKGSNYKATVMRFNGTAWQPLGAPGFSAGGVSYTSLAFSPGGTPYVVYQDGSSSSKATVMRWVAQPTLALSASASPSVLGQGVTFTATLTGAANPTGAIAFEADGAPLCTATLPATACTAQLTAGAHTITASYAGDADNTAATSNALAHQVDDAAFPVTGGTAAVHITGPAGCTLASLALAPATPADNLPANTTAPLGVLRFTAAGCPGATLDVQIDYPAGSLAGLAPQKYGPHGGQTGWFTPATLSVNNDTVHYTVTDDGEGDNDQDPLHPGVIADPFAALMAAAPAGAQAIPTLGEWGWLLLTALLGLLGWRRIAVKSAASARQESASSY